MADVRSASIGLTHPHGHPHQLRRGQGDPEWPTVSRPEDAAAFVEGRIAEGPDYIKVIIEDGTMMNTSLPAVSPEVVHAVVDAAHDRGLMVLAHALTAVTTRLALDVGADGLAHLMVDEVIPDDLIGQIVDQQTFVIPTLVLAASAASNGAGPRLAADPRVTARLTGRWIDNLWHEFAVGADLDTALEPVRRPHNAGVRLLAGTDAAHFGALGLAPRHQPAR